MFDNMTDSMGQAFYYYDKYVRAAEMAGKEPVSFLKFLLGKVQ